MDTHGLREVRNPRTEEPPKNLRLTSSGVSLNDIGYLVERETGFKPFRCVRFGVTV